MKKKISYQFIIIILTIIIITVLLFTIKNKKKETEQPFDGKLSFTCDISEKTKREPILNEKRDNIVQFHVQVTNNGNYDIEKGTLLLCLVPGSNETDKGLSLLPKREGGFTMNPDSITIKKNETLDCYFYLEKRFWDQIDIGERKQMYMLVTGTYGNDEPLYQWYTNTDIEIKGIYLPEQQQSLLPKEAIDKGKDETLQAQVAVVDKDGNVIVTQAEIAEQSVIFKDTSNPEEASLNRIIRNKMLYKLALEKGYKTADEEVEEHLNALKQSEGYDEFISSFDSEEEYKQFIYERVRMMMTIHKYIAEQQENLSSKETTTIEWETYEKEIVKQKIEECGLENKTDYKIVY